MTGNVDRPDIRLLADLDAGLLDAATARAVRAAAEADPAARAVLDALTATRAELAALPDPPVPPALAARWSAALAAEQSLHPPVGASAPEAPISPDGVSIAPPPTDALPPAAHPRDTSRRAQPRIISGRSRRFSRRAREKTIAHDLS